MDSSSSAAAGEGAGVVAAAEVAAFEAEVTALEAENAALKEENERLRVERHGDVRKLAVVPSGGGTIAISDALAGMKRGAADAGTYFYFEQHGPFARRQLKSWRDDGHFDAQKLVRRGPRGVDIGINDAIQALNDGADGGADDEWYYYVQHGPYTADELRMWRDDGHFPGEKRVRRGRHGVDITINDALSGVVADGGGVETRVAAKVAAECGPREQEMDHVLSRGGWYYADDGDAALQHGPFATEKLQAWYDGEYFAPEMLVRWGTDGEDVSIDAALRDGQPEEDT